MAPDGLPSPGEGEPTSRPDPEAVSSSPADPESGVASQTEPKSPPPGATDQSTASFAGSEPAVHRVGAYHILETIGQGGMGVVYLAEQERPIRRLVALKLVKLGMDTKEVVARFEAERQALALMDHPNIAKVFEAGSTPEGRPYFVMEYVRGDPLTSYCDKQQLTTGARLELFLQLCDGVQHAHQKAIIHRDLKPSNVIVTIQNESPMPKIIDFGVAKATAHKLTEKTMYTALGELIGTPEYMSPEQAEMSGADVDTRTDVYALGVILYELLTGALPFDPQELRKAGFAGIVRTLRELEPARPSTRVGALGERAGDVAKARRTLPERLRSSLRGDLDWITMKALEKDRTRRYGSAADLAADIRRHLRHEPVLASPPSVAYRMRKFVRRHAVGVGIAATAALVLVAFAMTMTVQANRIARERDRANLEADAARDVTDFLVSLFDASDPHVARGDTMTARQILEIGSAKVRYELREQPLLRARILEAMGRVYQNLALYDRADAHYQEALELRQATLGERHVDVAKSLSTLGWLRLYQGRLEEGRTLVERALRIQRQELPQDHIDTAWSLFYLGALENEIGEPTSARENLETARAIFEKREGPYSVPVSWCWLELANVYFLTGDNRTALECYKRALAIKERILPPNHPDLAISLEGLGNFLGQAGQYTEALATLKRALEILETTLGNTHFETARCNVYIGLILTQVGQHTEALAALERALAVFETTLGNNHLETARCKRTIGYALRIAGRFEEARPYLEQALQLYRPTLGEGNSDVANVLDDLGVLEHHAGHHSQADSLYAMALPMLEKASAPGVGDASLIGLLQHRATCLRELNRQAQADSLEVRAGAIQAELDRQRGKTEVTP